MKAIIFHTLGAFNDERTHVVVCSDDLVNEVIEKEQHLCSEITDHEVVPCTIFEK